MKHTPLYEQRGAGYLGLFYPLCWNGSWPLAKIKIFDNEITISVWPFKKTIQKTNIDSFSKITSIIFGPGIQIKHKAGGAPYVVFWGGTHTDEIIKYLKQIHIPEQSA